MKDYLLQFIIQVNGAKYREFMNFMEKQLTKEKPIGCASRMICQSIADNNVFVYTEHWSNLESLELHLNSASFQALNGALKVLTTVQDLRIQECIEIEKSTIFKIKAYHIN